MAVAKMLQNGPIPKEWVPCLYASFHSSFVPFSSFHSRPFLVISPLRSCLFYCLMNELMTPTV
uniref:Uncharacterized protein n=1 Tax=Rhizophora mucronata TaxID=61149 RepID=A0A2P2N377_RHIMU